MRQHKLLLVFTFFAGLIFSSNSQAQFSKDQQIDEIFNGRKEVSFNFHVDNKDVVNNDLTYVISIDQVLPAAGGGYDVRAYANKKEFAEFLERKIEYQLIDKTSAKAYNMATTVAQMATWDRYPIYAVYVQMMEDFQSNYPSLCKLDTILSSTPDGHKILAVKISDNVQTAENEPRLLYTSSIHGDETTGYYLMLRLINYLLTNYGSVSKVTNLVNNVEIYINPLSNPDGTYASGDNTISPISSTRSNSYGVDMNRNYADPRDGQHPDGEAWQPETQAFMAYASLRHFNIAANFHGGAELINYPWDTWTTSGNSNADRLWWERVCTAYVDTSRLVDGSYMTDTYSDGVSEGGDWYVITGGRQDYMNFFQHCREVTIELDGTKTTETQNLPGEWNKNYHALLNYIQESTYGIRGLITDSCSGQPIEAKVWVTGYDQTNDSSQVYSYLPVGDYHKYLIAGTYSVTYSAPGYASKTVNNVVVTNSNATVVNVSLAPALPTANFNADVTTTCSGIVNFTDLSAGGATSWSWNFGDGFGSSAQDPVHVYTSSGTFTVSLTVTNCKGSDVFSQTAYIAVTLASPPSVTPAANCGQASLVLSASGSGTLSWYDALTGGTLVGTGTTFTTPLLSSTTTYYVQSDNPSTPVFGGKLDDSGAGGYYTNTGVHGLYFDCLENCTLVSVNVYSGNSGNKTIEIPALSLSTSVPVVSGINTITLNWAIPVGTNYLIRSTAACNLFRNGASSGPNIGYPFDISGMLTIQQSTAGAPNEEAYYYYFYNWQVVGESCSSSRVAVTATIDPMPVAGFTYSTAGGTATFTNTSSDASTFYWDFGDGQTATSSDPVHVYSTDGTYDVMLIVTNSCGSDTITNQVTIVAVGGLDNEDVLSQLKIYPVPAQKFLYLSIPASKPLDCEVEIISLTGVRVMRELLVFSGQKEVNVMDVSKLKQGVYFISLKTGDTVLTRKIIIE